MKKTMTMGAMAVALLAAVSCSNEETDIITGPDNGDQIALGITPNLKVDAGTKAATKSVVSGTAITYPEDKFGESDYAPGLGILVTNKDVNGWYTPDGTEYKNGGHHVWYIGNAAGSNWISITEKKTTYALTEEVPYYLKKDVGQVYAYYPYDETLNISTLSSASDLKIPVTVLATGEIDATTNNAKKYWNNDGNAWVDTKTPLPNLSLATEKDYLYFAGTAGRYVNNGHTDGEKRVEPDADPNNADETNPGYKINLDMMHAMAMVSFRVYDGGHLSDNDVNFTKFEIKNHASSSNLFKTGDGKMSLEDGMITETTTTTSMVRTISNYVLMRLVETGATEAEHAFVGTREITGKTVSKAVSAIVYPIVSQSGNGFGADQIDVVITLKEGSKEAVDYPITLPANSWEAGKNIIYTFSAGRNRLTVVDVTVTDWEDKEQEEIPL